MQTNGTSDDPNRSYVGQPVPSLSPGLLNRLFAAAPGVLHQLWVKPNGQFGFDFISGRVEEMFGITARELYEHPERMLDFIPPEDRAALIHRLTNDDGSVREKTFVDRYISRDGEMRWIRNTIFVEAVPGEDLVRFTTHTIDATDEIESQNRERGIAQRLQAMVESSPDAIWILRAIEADGVVRDFEVTDFNRAAERMFGARRKWVLGKTVRELAALNPALDCLALYLEVFRNKKRDEKVLLTSLTRKESRWIRRQIRPLEFGLAVVARDITEERKTLERSEESELKFRQMADHIDEAFWLNSIEPAKILYMSPAFERITGISTEDVCRDSTIWRRAIHPEHVERVVAEFESWLKLEGDYNVEYPIRRSDGQWRWIRDKGVVVRNEEGQPYRLVGITRDITEEKDATDRLARSEAKYRGIVATSQEGIAVLDQNGRVEFTNSRMLELLDCSEEELIGRSLGQWVTPENLSKAGPIIGDDLPTGTAVLPIRFLRRDSTLVHVQASVSQIYDAEGKPNGRLIMAADISSLIKAEEKMRQLDQQLARVARLSSMGETTAEIAHELNQPLHAMSNFADACNTLVADQSGELFDKLRNYLGQVSKAVQRASGIVRRIGNYVKNNEPDRRWVDLNALVEEMTELVKMASGRDNIQFRLNLDKKLPPVLVDTLLIGQVIVNLVRNSVEALGETKQKNKRITISTKWMSNSEIRVAVEDNGPGIPAEAQGRIFEAFYTSKEEGTGLGLPICRTIVEAHEGRLWYEPREKGAEFVFTLPHYTQEAEEKSA